MEDASGESFIAYII